MNDDWEGVTIECPFCEREVAATAAQCESCGFEFNKTKRRLESKSKHRSGLATLMSLVIPGTGQLYQEKYAQAILWFVFTVVGYACFIIPGILLHLLCIFDAATSTRD